MSTATTYDKQSEALHAALEKRLGLKNKTFDARLSKAMARFPKRERRAAQEILAAREKMQHPKLARLIDAPALDTAFETVQSHVRSIDIHEERVTRLLGTLGVIVFNLLLLAVGVVLFLRWKGLL